MPRCPIMGKLGKTAIEGHSMKEAFGDLWEVDADLRVITTNGFVKNDGRCVMGRGCARQARDRFPGLDKHLGGLIKKHGNRVMRLGVYDGVMLASLPVKHHWRETADLRLIERSLRQLVELADKFGYEKVAVPRPGCGNGSLDWEGEVEPVAAKALDDRFTIVSFPSESPGAKAQGSALSASVATGDSPDGS